MIASVISFLLGVCTLHSFSSLPSYGLMLGGISVLALLGIFTLCCPQYSSWKGLKLQYLCIYGAGFLWISLHAHWYLAKQLPEDLQGQPLSIMGSIASIPDFKEGSAQFEFEVEEAGGWKNPGRVRLTWREYRQNTKEIVRVGDKWKFTVKLKRPRSYANPGSFDTERHFFLNHLQAQGNVIDKYKKQFFVQKKLDSSFLNYPVDRIRDKIQNALTDYLKGYSMGGLISALIVGIKDQITVEQWAVFRDTGTAHLMAISGLHVGLVAGFAFLMLLYFWRLLPTSMMVIAAPWIAAVGALGAALFYALLAGFSVPTQRSVVMLALLMMGFLSKRVMSVWRSYFLALALILIWDPLATLSVGFWLSFSAVGVILYGMGGRLQPKGFWWKWGRAQWVVFLGLIPVTLAAFQQMSLVSPLANLIAIPWVSFLVVPMALAGSFFLLCLGGGGRWLLIGAEKCLGLLWPFLEYLAHFPKATWVNAEMSIWTIASGMFGVLLLLAPKGFPGRGVGLIWILPLFLAKSPGVSSGMARITVLDVGQGLSTVVETAKHTLVFDTGPKLSAQVDTGDRVVAPFLATRGRTHIDTLVISHGDNDHAGGAESILKQMPVLNILTSEPHLFSDRNPQMCRIGHQWVWDGVQFEILHPDTVNTKKRNDHSCVLRVQAGNTSALITGDIEARSEKKILQREKKKLKSTILVVPHHGSRTSSSIEFIQGVAPLYAIIPAGYRNQYGHPKPDIVERYKQAGINVLNTVQDGAITFLLKETDTLSTPSRYRIDTQKYWTEF